MKKRRILAGTIMICMLCGIGCPAGTGTVRAEENWRYGLDGEQGWNSGVYYPIHNSGTDGKSDNNWRHALATANGKLGVLESGDPDEDVLIYQNTKLILDGEQIMTAPDIADALDQQRANAVSRENIGYWQGKVREYNKQIYGVDGHLSSNTRPYHPGAQLRIKNLDYTEENRTKYNRYTNFESGEVGAQWKDASGKEWDRRTFASRTDDVVITVIEAPEGEQLHLTLQIDNMLEMGIDNSKMKEYAQTSVIPETSEFVEQDEKGYHIGQVGKYGVMHIGGKEENPECEYARGGYATAIRLLPGKGAVLTKGSNTRDIHVPANFGTEKEILENQTSDNITVTGTNRLILISKIDNQKTGLNDIEDVKQELYASLLNDVDEVAARYQTNGEFDYERSLAPHKALQSEMFGAVRLDLCATEEEKADRQLSNEALIEKQKSQAEINKAYLERLFYNGRYAAICSSGYGAPRLGGIWVGNWMPDWSGDYTLDANVNLQVSGMNTGHLDAMAKAYIDFTLRHAADWETNAKKIYGIDDAIMAPPRVDGSGNGQLFHMLAGYPFAYWNAGADWLLIPIYEYYQCYGNRKISVGEDIDLERLTSLLDLDENDKRRIREEGFDLLTDILDPLTRKLANFWQGYVSEEFYVDSDRKVHLKDGTTIADGGDRAEYLFSPGYSPENVPSKDGTGYNGTPSLAANTAMDIAAAHDSLDMARAVAREVDGESAAERIARWDALEDQFPSYLYEPDGALKEWALESMEEHYNHRHVSHTYAAWPGYEAQNDTVLSDGLKTALDMRYQYNTNDNAQAHGHMHNALAEARLKRVTGYETSLYTLVNSGYQYSNLLTSHNKNQGSAFCTDNAIGLTGAVIEGLAYSNTGEVEVLPTLISSWEKGSVSGLMTRARAEMNELSWDKKEKTVSVTLTSNKDGNQIKLMCGPAWVGATVNGEAGDVRLDENGRAYTEITLDDGQSAEVRFALADVTGGTYAVADDGANGMTPAENNLAEGAPAAMQPMTDTDLTQRFVMGTVTLRAQDMEGEPFSEGEYTYFNSVSTPDCYINMHGGSDYIGKEDGKITLYTDLPKRYNNVFRITDAGDGYVYIETTGGGKLPADSVLAVAKRNVDTDTDYDRMEDGVRITHQRKAAGDDYQKWEIRRHMDYVTIKNKATGSYISAVNRNGEVCQKAPMQEVVPEDIQTWNIHPVPGEPGCYSIQNTYSGRYLTEQDRRLVLTRNGGTVWRVENRRILTADRSKAVYRQEDGTLALTEETGQGTEFTFLTQKTVDAGAVPDRIVVTDTKGSQGTIHTNIAESVRLLASVTPRKAESRGVNWIVENVDGTKADEVVISQDGLATFKDGAKGNRYYVYAESRDGSCRSNRIHLMVSGLEVSETRIEMESYEYGFGNFKNEGTNVGTIDNTAVLKYQDISADDLKSIAVTKSNTSPSYVQLFFDADTDITDGLAYDGAYGRDSGGTEASRRYALSHIKGNGVPISDRIRFDSGEAEKTIPVTVPDGLSGTHDLYVRIEKVSGTWLGNFDFMICKYSSGEETQEVLPGDVNDDGRITSVDALLALRGSVGGGLSGTQEQAADVAAEIGTIDVKDVLAILKMASSGQQAADKN